VAAATIHATVKRNTSDFPTIGDIISNRYCTYFMILNGDVQNHPFWGHLPTDGFTINPKSQYISTVANGSLYLGPRDPTDAVGSTRSGGRLSRKP